MIAAILNSAILNSAILYKKNFTHSFWLNLMMAAILNSAILDSDTAILDSDTLLSSLWFTEKHSSSTLTLTQTNSIWLKLIHSDLTWWWQSILNLAILDSANLVFPLKLTHTFQDWFPLFAQKKLHSFILTQLDDGSHLEFCHLGFSHLHKKISLIHSHSTWWWQPSWILPSWIQTLPSWIQTPCYLLSDSLKNTLTPLWLWLKLIPSD